MAADLRPEGIPVYVEDVVITTPGLAGRVEVYAGGSAGMRAAEDTTEAFRRALDEAGVAEQLTVEVSQHSELDAAGGTRAGGGGSEITVEVPAPGQGNGQLLLYAAEDGSLTWHLPADVAPGEVATRGGERRTYRIPREVVSPDSGLGGSGQRGLLGAVGTKLFKVLVFPLIDPVLGRVGDYFAGRWEEHHRRNEVRWFGPDAFQTAVVPAFGVDDWTRVRGGTALLFIHGTTAQAHTAFAQLPAETLAELQRRYGGRVFALDHFTISVTPHDNVRWLAEHLGDGAPLTLDVVAHSRGGLVGRALAERADELGLAGRLRVRTLVMVGTPNAGTALADRDHVSQLLDRFTDLVQYLPDNGVTDVVGLVLSILKQLSIGAFGGLEGIMSMNPTGSYLTAFNAPALEGAPGRDAPALDAPAAAGVAGSPVTYRAIASNYQPPQGSSLARIARNGATDIVFANTSNDLVVPTNGVFEVAGAAGFPVADPLVFPAEAGVDHSSYFGRPEVAARLLEWLPGG